ncbi:DUF4236 domain-containing protein [Pelagicoccus sp. SDUM812002]|uniref:DUF4236 domain-containing protein n=1 Tax=Pelagicoccus sp. SDUM812002 TaxID=3041266 RepID=UPI00280E83F6|nr:DUF4236 domain-containing protein [Pelagicoccus sp. SDUM812002]MDQ8184252.1 DUF4236 domain-containing protein [Pelagicoccus sp. SDUM812002]
MRFRKRIRIAPGIRLNLSLSGVSATIGPRGFNVNVGKKGAYLNTGIPGTGLYDRQRITPQANRNPQELEEREQTLEFEPKPETEFKSRPLQEISSNQLDFIKEQVSSAIATKREIGSELNKAFSKHRWHALWLLTSRILIFGFFVKKIKVTCAIYKAERLSLQKEYDDYQVDFDFEMDKKIKSSFNKLETAFGILKSSKAIWDVTTESSVDQFSTRSAASHAIERTKTRAYSGSNRYFKSNNETLAFENKNGGDIHLHPGFVLVEGSGKEDFALIPYSEINLIHNPQKFVESSAVPSDAEIVEYTYKYVNKSGTRDKRFKDNPQIPVTKYYDCEFRTTNGLCERFEFSNWKSTQSFAQAFEEHQKRVSDLKW